MGLFRKKQLPKSEKNLIDDKEQKEIVANFAIDFLTKNNIISDLNGISCEFGYIFYIENHGYECLFKISKETKVYYFAFQWSALQMLNMDEGTYQAYVSTFLEIHK